MSVLVCAVLSLLLHVLVPVRAGIGTPMYMAPEIIVGDQDALRAHPFACDIYSYAILAWEVRCGAVPCVMRACKSCT